MYARNAHASCLRVKPGCERAERVDATANSVLRFEDDDIVALALELEATHQAGESAADDDHAFATLGPWTQPVGRHGQYLARHWRRFVRRRLAARIGRNVGHGVTLPRPKS